MRVGFVSSFPPAECGIATYTQYLTEAMKRMRLDVYVVCHLGGSGQNVFPAFDYEDSDLAEAAFSTMIRLTPDVVHIQHEFGLFGRHAGVSVVPLIILFRQAGIPVVTTLHTVYAEVPEHQREVLQAIVNHSDRLIVHEPYQYESLQRHFGAPAAEKASVIPHGARLVEPVPDAKKRLGISPERKVILLIGYFRPSKNFELVVDALPSIVSRCPEAVLLLAGKVRGNEHIDYRDMLLNRIANSPVREHIYLARGQLPQDVFDLLMSAADVVVLPYRITSQSGILAHCLAFGRPVVVSANPAMNQIMQRCRAGLTCKTDEEFVEAICRILADRDLAQQMSAAALRYVKEEIGWPHIARRTIELYRSVVRIPNQGIQVIDVD